MIPLPYPQQQQQAFPLPYTQYTSIPYQGYLPPVFAQQSLQSLQTQPSSYPSHRATPSSARHGSVKQSSAFNYSGGFALKSAASIGTPPQQQHYPVQTIYTPNRPANHNLQQYLSPSPSSLNRSEHSGSRSPASPSSGRSPISPANAKYTSLGLPCKPNIIIRFPKEVPSPSVWHRVALELPVQIDQDEDSRVESTSREVHEDEVPRYELPNTIEIYLPGRYGWTDLLEELWQTRSSKDIPTQPYENLPPDLLKFKLDDLMNASNLSSPTDEFHYPSQPVSPFFSKGDNFPAPSLNPAAPVFQLKPEIASKPSFNPNAVPFNPNTATSISAVKTHVLPALPSPIATKEWPKKGADLSREELEFGLGIRSSPEADQVADTTQSDSDLITNPSESSETDSDDSMALPSPRVNRGHQQLYSIQSQALGEVPQQPVDNVRHFKFPSPTRPIATFSLRAPTNSTQRVERASFDSADSLWDSTRVQPGFDSVALSLDDIAVPTIPRKGSRAVLSPTDQRRKMTSSGRMIGRTTSATSISHSEREEESSDISSDEGQSESEATTWQLLSNLLDVKLRALQEDLTGCFNLTADMDSMKKDALLDDLLSRIESSMKGWKVANAAEDPKSPSQTGAELQKLLANSLEPISEALGNEIRACRSQLEIISARPASEAPSPQEHASCVVKAFTENRIFEEKITAAVKDLIPTTAAAISQSLASQVIPEAIKEVAEATNAIQKSVHDSLLPLSDRSIQTIALLKSTQAQVANLLAPQERLQGQFLSSLEKSLENCLQPIIREQDANTDGMQEILARLMSQAEAREIENAALVERLRAMEEQMKSQMQDSKAEFLRQGETHERQQQIILDQLASFGEKIQADREEQQSARVEKERLHQELRSAQQQNAELLLQDVSRQHEIEMMKQKRQDEIKLETQKMEAERQLSQERYKSLEQKLAEQIEQNIANQEKATSAHQQELAAMAAKLDAALASQTCPIGDAPQSKTSIDIDAYTTPLSIQRTESRCSSTSSRPSFYRTPSKPVKREDGWWS